MVERLTARDATFGAPITIQKRGDVGTDLNQQSGPANKLFPSMGFIDDAEIQQLERP